MKQQAYLFVFLILLLTVVLSAKPNKVAQTLKETLGFKCPSKTAIKYPIRLALNNKIQCLSSNGRKCLTGLTTEKQCKDYFKNKKKPIKTKTCTRKEMKKKGHWCQKAAKYFFRKWHCQGETGLRQIVRFNRKSKNVECLSKNGINCLRPIKECKKRMKCPAALKKLKRISCGRPHIKLWGHTGYHFMYKHWCQRALAFFKYNGKILFKKHTKMSIPIRLNSKGKVQCVSKNRKKCLRRVRSKKALKGIFKNKKLKFITCGHESRRATGKPFPYWCKRGYRLYRGKKVFGKEKARKKRSHHKGHKKKESQGKKKIKKS